jgi:hypothetical protein
MSLSLSPKVMCCPRFLNKAYLLAACWLFIFFAIQFATADVSISSRFNPSEVLAGQFSTFEMIVEGDGTMTEVHIPQVKGLRMAYRGQQQSFQAGTGGTFSRSIFTFSAIADEKGAYTVPEFQILVRGQQYTVPEATLNVREAPPDLHYLAGGNQTGQISTSPRPVRFEVVTPLPDPIYVGQTVPCAVRLGVREGVSAQLISQKPTVASDALLIDSASDPALTNSTDRYREATFWQKITALKTGTYPLSFEMDILVQLPTRPWYDHADYQAFSILSNAMASQQRMPVHTSSQTVNIIPLPEKGQPASFSGAIGQFEVSTILSTNECEVGEPITLTLCLNGEGNFGRITCAPEMKDNENWRIYTPRMDFSPKDVVGYSGIKRIEYILSPNHDQITKTPRVEFSYFDPQTHQYVTYLSNAFDVTVKESAAVTDSGSNLTNDIEPASTPKKASNSITTLPESALFKQLRNAMPRRQELEQLAPWISYVIVIIVLLLLIRWLYIKRLASKRYKINRILSQHLHAIKEAATNQQSEIFFAHTHTLLQELVGDKKHALTWQELLTKIERAHPKNLLMPTLREIATHADAQRFGNEPTGKQTLTNFYSMLKEHLAATFLKD